MKSTGLRRLLDRRVAYSLASLGLLLSLAAPSVIPAFVSAAQLSQRSVTMSTSAVGATAQYNIKFTGDTGITVTENEEGGVAIEFCTNSGVVGDSGGCDRPGGMTTGSATLVDVLVNGVSATDDGAIDNNGPDDENGSIVWTAGEAYAGDVSLEIVVSGIVNPSSPGVFYARVSTYSDNIATEYTGEDTAEVGEYDDEGSMALAATLGIGISSYVSEAMSFCVSGGDVGDTVTPTANVDRDAPSENCGTTEDDCDEDEVGSPDVLPGCVFAPSMTLGQDDGNGNIALSSGALSTGGVWAQLSSNAVGNTVVNLKSDAINCGGLYRNGVSDAAHCNIGPDNNDTLELASGTAAFGLLVGTAVAAPDKDGGAGTGSGTIAPSGNYGSSDYFMDFVAGNATGVTSTYGSPLFTATGAVDNMNVPITFGASIGNNTPAGTYGANLSLVATGTF